MSLFIEKMSLYSPIIIITGVFMVSLFAGSISKGLTYIFCVLVAGVLRHAFLNPDNSTSSNKLVVVLDFGGNKTCTNGTFTVTFPSPTGGSPSGSAAIISITS